MLPLASLAAKVHISPFHFQRVFARVVGESPAAYARRLRLEHAAFLLSESSMPVLEVCRAAGFERAEVFSRAFRRAFGRPPNAWPRWRTASELPPSPAQVRVWVNRPTRAMQLRLMPTAPSPAVRRRPQRLVRIETLHEVRIGFVRLRGTRSGIAAGFNDVLAWASGRGLGAMAPDPLCLGLVHDDPAVTPFAKRRYDVCVAVAKRRRAAGPVGVRRVPGGVYAAVTHQGPRSTIPRTRAWLRRAAAAMGRRMRSGPSIEVFLDDPRVARADALTDILVPVEAQPRPASFFFRRRRPLIA